MKLKSILLTAVLLGTSYTTDSYASSTTESTATKAYETALQEYNKKKSDLDALKQSDPAAYKEKKQALKAELEKQKEALKASDPQAYAALKQQRKAEKKALKTQAKS